MTDTSQQTELPNSDQFFGGANDNSSNAQLPTADQFFAPPKPTAMDLTVNAAKSLSGYVTGDHTPSAATQEFLKGTSVGRIANAVGGAFQEQFQGELGLPEDTIQSLRKAGFYNDYANGGRNIMKAMNEVLLTPAAAAADAAYKGLNAVVSGVAQGATQTMAEGLTALGIGSQSANQISAEETANMALNSPLLAEPHGSALPRQIASAKSAGVLETEDVFTGVKEPTPQQTAAMHDAAATIAPEVQEIKEPTTPFDVREAARNIAPETFDKYDRLSVAQDNLRNQLSDLSAQRTADLDAQIKEIQDAKKGGYGKLQALLEKRNDIASIDTPEMSAIRHKMQENDYAMRDLSPQVSAAMRTASEFAPKEPETTPIAEETKTASEGAVEPSQEPTLQENLQPKPIEEQRQNIIDDISQKLSAIGRPKEEVDAVSQLEAARYETLAAQYPKFSAEEWYNRESANIKAGRERARVLAQEETPSLDNNSGLAGRPNSQTRPTVSPGTHEPSRQTSEASPPSGIFTTRAKSPSTSEGGVSISNDLGISEGYHKTKDVQELKSLASKAEPDLHNLLKNISENTDGAEFSGVRLKDERSLNSKLQNKLPEKISDYLGGRIIVDTPEAMTEVLERLKQVGDVTHVDDFTSEGRPTGYRAIHAQIMGTDGLSAEVQIQPREIAEAQREAHRLYKEWQGSVAKGDVDKALIAKEEGKKIYDDAWQKWNDRQGQELEQAQRGKIRLATDEAKATITLMKSANASTLIHEKGHEWADQLMRLSKYDDAPEQMKRDAETLRQYADANEDGIIPTRGHEKIARGFERYLMEGVAPSKELAGVFAKFKQWLMQIYQAVERLRSPISDDIRDVFDRLLSKNPEKIVVAPEHEAGKMMADIHEADAEHTPPEHAHDAADNMRGEIDQTAKSHDKDAYDELRSAEAGRGTEQVAGDQRVAAEQPDAIAPEPSPISPSGGEAAPESDGLRPAEQPATKPKPESGDNADAAKVLGKPKSDLVDKAGNIRLDNLNAPEDVNEVIRQTAAENNDFVTARGVVSDDQVMRLADSLGVRASEINLKKISDVMGPGQLASKIIAARKLLVQSATDLRDAMAKAATGSDEDVMAYAEAKARHVMIQQQVSGVTAEAGRALRAFRNIEGSQQAQAIGDFLKQATGKDLFQLKEEAKLGATLDTPEKISKFIQDSKKPSFGDMVLEYWVNGLISGPATHTTYAIGNTLLGLWKAIPETAVASLVGKARNLITGEAQAVKLGEVGAQLKGAVESLPSAVSAAGKALKTGLTTLLPGEEMSAQAFGGRGIPENIGNQSVNWREAGADAFGAVKGLRDAFIASGDLTQTGAIPDFALGGIKIPLGSVIRAPARAIAAIHSFFRTVNYSMDKAAIAYRTATDEGLTGNDFAARIGDIVTNPSEEDMAQARGSATNLTLMGEGGGFTKAISKLTNVSLNLPLLGETKLLKFIDPFVHIGSNVIDQAILQRTPIGLLSPEIRADLAGINGAVKRDFAASRMIVGSALAITIGGLAAEGLVSGSGPSDPKEASAWKLLGGNQPHSIKIGDVWYDTHRLGPLGMVVGISADLYDVAHAIGKEDATKVGSMLVHAITQNILDESFMRGPSDLIKALTDSDRYGDAYLRNFISSFVPFSVGLSQTARSIDPYTRQTRTVMDAIKNKIPFVSEGLYPRRDVWGQPIANKDVLGPAGFSAIYESRVTKDPVNQKLLALGVFPSQPERKIRGVQLTDQQYDDFCKIAGKTAKMRLDAIVPNPGFSNLPETAQVDIIKNTIKTSRETASSIVMMQNLNIIHDATEQKMKALRGEKK